MTIHTTSNKTNRGFTLIELLVVIAIIGILSSIVLASLNSARNSAQDARARADIANARVAAELEYSDANNYDAVDGCGGQVAAYVADHPTADCTTNASSGSQAYAISVELGSGTFYCVDSRGYNDVGAATSSGGQCQ